MKTIEVSDEIYEQLMELSRQMNSQNHRSTAMPYIFQIREKKRIHGVDENYNTDGYVWVNSNRDGHVEGNRKSMIEALEQDDVEFDREISDYDLDQLMEENRYYKGWYRIEEVYSNAFLTEKSCKEHIRLNGYHYEDPVDHLTHAFRNPDLELVSRFLCELTGGKIHT